MPGKSKGWAGRYYPAERISKQKGHNSASIEEILGQTFSKPHTGKAWQKRHPVWIIGRNRIAMYPSNKFSSFFALFSIMTFIAIVVLMIGGFF
jgi:hypothetical protein